MPGLPEASTVTPKTTIAVGAVLPILAAIAVAFRFYVRIARRTSVGLDDCLILFALVSFSLDSDFVMALAIDTPKTLTFALGITMIVGKNANISGRSIVFAHGWDSIGSAINALAQPTPLGDGPMGFMVVLNRAIITTEKVVLLEWIPEAPINADKLAQMKWAFNLLQVLILGSIKLSVISFYRRIFRGKAFDFYSKGMLAIVCTWTIAFFFTVLFECRTDFRYLWSTLLDLLTHCTNDVMYLKAYAISDVITDGLILAMPIPTVGAERDFVDL